MGWCVGDACGFAVGGVVPAAGAYQSELEPVHRGARRRAVDFRVTTHAVGAPFRKSSTFQHPRANEPQPNHSTPRWRDFSGASAFNVQLPSISTWKFNRRERRGANWRRSAEAPLRGIFNVQLPSANASRYDDQTGVHATRYRLRRHSLSQRDKLHLGGPPGATGFHLHGNQWLISLH